MKYERLLRPRGIAVIGATQKQDAYGYRVPSYLLKHGYTGEIYPINPKYEEILGLKCYGSIAEVPGPLDAAVVLTSGPKTVAAVSDLAEKGAVVAVIPGDVLDAELGKQVREIVDRTGIRIVGPNCVGVANFHYHSILSICSTLRIPAEAIKPGGVGIISQSGGILGTALDRATIHGIGISMIASAGPELDMDISDYIDVMIEDPNTKAISLYVETIRKPAKFFEAARRAVSIGKPVAVLKGGRTDEGSKSAESHSGRLAGDYKLIQALFKKYGIIELTHMDDLFFVPDTLIRVKPSQGGVAVVSLSGGTATHVADVLAEAGVPLSPLTEETKEKLAAISGPHGTYNPLDADDVRGPGGGPTNMHDSLLVLDNDPTVGTLVFADTMMMPTKRLAQEVVRASEKAKKPIVVCWPVGDAANDGYEVLLEASIPSFKDCQRFAASMRAVFEWLSIQSSISETATTSENIVHKQEVSTILSDSTGGSLDEKTSKYVMSQYGIPVVPEFLALSPEEAVDAAERLGYPVVLKIVSPDVPHKTEAGGVKLGLTNAEAVKEAYQVIYSSVRAYNPTAKIEGVLVGKMINNGVELLAGIKNDPDLGLFLIFGAGGIYTELLGGVSIVAAPVTLEETLDLITSSKVYPLLQGYRGKTGANIQAIAEALVSLSNMAIALGDRLAEVDINPLMALPDGVVALDGLIVLRDETKDKG
ncbi:MAG: acetate--CoA ligase family protein [Syntrophomonadaceae bacterium]|jgi:acyl-CoA synthetase (NDP forming)